MDLRQLEILQAIAETGSFTACGRKLHVSQSAISRQIMLLEEELGEPLFLRVGRQVRMTPAAESLVQLGQRVLQDVRELLCRREEQAVVAVSHALGEAGAVVEGEYGNAGAKEIRDLHRNIEAR